MTRTQARRCENPRRPFPVFQSLENCAALISNDWKFPAARRPALRRAVAVRAIRRSFFLAAWLAAATAARALGPHEIALLVNANSPASREIANCYAKMRGVPVQNILWLDLPADFGGATSSISTQQFMRLVWAPATNLIAQRGLGDHLLAWVYSAGFPAAVEYSKNVSIHGMTFVRGRLPPPDDIDKARYASQLFRGPAAPGGPQGPSLSMEQFAVMFATNMPLPAMTLGHVSPRGLPVPEILDSLRYSARADATRPDAAVNFVLSSDVRSTCRAWEVPGTADELKKLGVKALVTSNMPDRKQQLIGLQVGAADITKMLDVKLQPGSMAEHLTSFGADFSSDGQSKITLWIKAGAAGTAGTVIEPYALWPKFPHARFFAHYAAGCTMLESFVQSLASPLETFLLGDPLARPYGTAHPITLVCLADDDDAISGTAEFLAAEPNGFAPRDMTFIYLLDGRAWLAAGTGSRAKIDVSKLDDGWHELRAVGYSGGAVRQQTFATKYFGVRNHDRSVKISAAGGIKPDEAGFAELKLEATGGPEHFEIIAQGRVIGEGTSSVMKVNLGPVGPGPVWLQAAARYEKGGSAWSRPQIVEIKPPPR